MAVLETIRKPKKSMVDRLKAAQDFKRTKAEALKEFREALNITQMTKEYPLTRNSELPPNSLTTESLCEKIILIAEAMGEITFYSYQRKYVTAILRSTLLGLGQSITALFSRQSGKSLSTACIAAAMAAVLPKLAQIYPQDWRLNRHDEQGNYRGFGKGISIGIYAPVQGQAQETLAKIRDACSTDTSSSILEDAGIKWAISNGANVGFTNGSNIRAVSASPTSNIEGTTHHLMIQEEAQDLAAGVVRKSLRPMLASTRGTCVKVGTANYKKSDFHDTIRKNMQTDSDSLTGEKKHFFFPHYIVSLHNSDYALSVADAITELGEDSDEFKMSYGCEFIFERGMFVTDELIKDESVGIRHGPFSKIYEGLTDQPPDGYSLVAGIDFGKKQDSTVVTLVAVDWTSPLIDFTAQDGLYRHTLYKKHIVGWRYWSGDDYEAQLADMLPYLLGFTALKKITMDSTSIGDAMFERISASMSNMYGIFVEGKVFTAQFKHEGYRMFANDLMARRLTHPRGVVTVKDRRYLRYIKEMLDLEKNYSGGGLLSVEAPRLKGCHDDFPDSAMLAVYGANEEPNSSMDMMVSDDFNLFSGV